MSSRTSTAPPKIRTRTRANSGPDFDVTPVTKLQQAGVILLGKLATHEFAYGGSHSTFPGRLPETYGTASTSLVVRNWWLDPGSIGAVCRFETDYGLVSRIRVYTNSFSYNHVGPMTWTAAANHADHGGFEVLGSAACEFRPGEQRMLLVSAPGDPYPPPSLSLIYYIITLDLEKTKQECCAGLLQLHYLAEIRHLLRRQDASVRPLGCSCAANKRHNKLPTRRTRALQSVPDELANFEAQYRARCMTTTDSPSAGHTIAICAGMTAHSSLISSSFIAGIVFGIVEFPTGGRAVYRVGVVGKEIQDREMNRMVPPLRSFLFAPGNHARRVEKALSLDADAVILDLEDAVAIAEKPATRAVVAAVLERPRQGLLYVRVNAVDTEFCYGDLVAVVRPGLDGIILPKVESAAGLATIDWLLAQLERERGLPPGTIDLIPIIETARGVQQIDAIVTAGTRIRRVAFGAGDFTLDVNMAWSRGETELAHPRAVIVTASRAAGIDAPLDTVWVDLTDPEGLEASARTALGYGFQGKMCIHPDQIAVVNRVFTPSDAEVAFADRVAAAFAKAEAEGSAAIQLDGKFIDYPIVYRAQRVLQKVAAIRAREGR